MNSLTDFLNECKQQVGKNGYVRISEVEQRHVTLREAVRTAENSRMPQHHARTIGEYIANVLEYIGLRSSVIDEPSNLENALWALAVAQDGTIVSPKLKQVLESELFRDMEA